MKRKLLATMLAAMMLLGSVSQVYAANIVAETAEVVPETTIDISVSLDSPDGGNVNTIPETQADLPEEPVAPPDLDGFEPVVPSSGFDVPEDEDMPLETGTQEPAEPDSTAPADDETEEETAERTLTADADGVTARLRGSFTGNHTFTAAAVDNPLASENIVRRLMRAIRGRSTSPYVGAYDLTLLESGTEVQPDGMVQVTLQGLSLRSQNVSVIHIINEESKDIADQQVIEPAYVDVASGTVVFYTDGFSIYVVKDDGNEDGEPQRTYAFYDLDLGDPDNVSYTPYEYVNKAGDLTYRQIMKNGAELEEVTAPMHAGLNFIGWYDAETGGNQVILGTVINDIEDTETQDNSVVELYARYDNVYIASFMQLDTGGNPTVTLTKKAVTVSGSGDPAELLIGDMVAGDRDSTHLFYGWTVDGVNHEIYDDTSGSHTQLTGKTITITDNVTLTPYFVEAYWLNFVAGEVGSYADFVPSRFVRATDGPITELPTTRRNGYVFDGWYQGSMNEDGTINYGTQVSDGDGNVLGSGLQLTETTTLYAKWSPAANASYSIVVWKQKITDDKNAADADKTYDYEASYVVEGAVTGAAATATANGVNYESQSFTGFHYGRTEVTGDGTIRSDGTTVVNVYYDRDLMTLEFWDTYQSVNNNSGTQFGVDSNGMYFVIQFRNNSWQYYDTSGWISQWRYYNGTRYRRTQTTTTMTGLYGQTLEQNGYSWPSSSIYWGYVRPEEDNSEYYNQFLTFLDAFDFNGQDTADMTTNTLRLYNRGNIIGSRTYNHYKQNLDGSYDYANPTNRATIGNNVGYFAFTDKYTGFTVHSYRQSGYTPGNTSNFQSATANQRIQLQSNSNLYIRYERNRYNLDYMVQEVPGGAFVAQNPQSILFEAPLNGYDSYVPADNSAFEHYTFVGWYADETCTQPFDFDTIMPAANVSVYAKYEPVYYRIEIDPNGGELQSDQGATFFWEQYGGKVSEYTGVQRNYVEDPNGEYVYRNVQYTGDDSVADRIARYILRSEATPGDPYIDFSKSYRLIDPAVDDTYILSGWYVRQSDGTLSSTPYNFESEVTEDITLVAVWRRNGDYGLVYNPVNTVTSNDGEEITVVAAVSQDSGRYADGAQTILNIPTVTTQGVIFDGWDVVDGDGNVIDDNGGNHYMANEAFTILASQAVSRTIRLQAHYSLAEDADIIGVTKLILDANQGMVSGTVTDAREHVVIAQTTTQVRYGDLQYNEIVDLSTVQSNFLRAGYELIGWNTRPDGTGDSFELTDRIAIDEDDPNANTLYAQWRQATVTVSGTKTWIDGNNAGNTRPVMITITIRNETDNEIAEELEIGPIDNWQWSLELPKYNANGVEITYSVSENDLSERGYEAVYDGYNITNVLYRDVDVIKIWDDMGNPDEKRPDNVTIHLLANNNDSDSVVLDASNDWMHRFEHLQAYDENDQEIVYTVVEKEVPTDYTCTITGNADDGFIVTNSRTVVPDTGIMDDSMLPYVLCLMLTAVALIIWRTRRRLY